MISIFSWFSSCGVNLGAIFAGYLYLYTYGVFIFIIESICIFLLCESIVDMCESICAGKLKILICVDLCGKLNQLWICVNQYFYCVNQFCFLFSI